MKTRTTKSGEERGPANSSRGETSYRPRKVLIAALVVLCLGALCFFIGRTFRGGGLRPGERKLEGEFVREELKIEESAKAYNERAIELAKRLMREFPGRGEPMFLLGQEYYEQENHDEAIELWEKALKIDSSRPEAYQAMGLMALQEGDYETAVSHWRTALEKDPDWPGIRRAIGLALMHQQRIEDAVGEFEADLKVSPDNAHTHFLLAQADFQLGRLDEAKKHYDSAIQLSSTFTSAYYGLSRVLTRLGQKEAAKEALDRFQELKTGERKAKREGEEAYDDILAQRGGLAMTYDRAGAIYLLYGNTAKAVDHFQVAARLDPTNLPSRLHLANIYAGRGQIEDAVRMYEELARAYPRDVRPYLSIGALYGRSGRLDDAEKSFRKAIQFAPRSPTAYHELAVLYAGARVKLDVAEALAKKALDLDSSAANYDLLGWVYYLNGKFGEAEAAASKALEIEPENQTYKNHHDTIREKRL